MSTMRNARSLMMLAALYLGASGSLPAQTFTTVFSFDGSGNSGATPAAGLVQGTDGNEAGTVRIDDSGQILCTAKTAAGFYQAVLVTPK